METKQFDSIMQEFKKMNQQLELQFGQIHKQFEQINKQFGQIDKQFGQIDKRFEQIDKRFEQMDEKFEKKFEKVDEKFLEIQRDMGLGFMRLEKKLDDYKEICIRQHVDILDLIETRVQKCKNDRENLHQGQDALNFRVEQLEASQKAI